MSFISVHGVHPYSSIDAATAWKKFRFILSSRSDFCMINNQSRAFQAFDRRMLTHTHTLGLAGRVFANDPEDWGSIPGRVIPKTSKMVLDTSSLNTQQYKVRIKDKVEQTWERSSALPYTLVW